MQWQDLIRISAERVGLKDEDAQVVIDAFFDTVIEGFRDAESVSLRPDFGYFEIREYGGELVNGRNDQYTKLHRTPVFKSSRQLKKSLRQNDHDYIAMLKKKGAEVLAEHIQRNVKIG
jgi:nucleoid DNA-binding protein